MNTVLPDLPSCFRQTLRAHGLDLPRTRLEILQVNVGRLCDLACTHCHVGAGPKRTEIMAEATVRRVLDLLTAASGIHTVDITGGAPEMNPHFRTLVVEARALGKQVIARSNLTVLFTPGQEDTPEFLAEYQVNVVASLPGYTQQNVEKQRGLHVFEPSIRALQKLNALGYGKPDTGLELDLIYNPAGASLPPPQAELEAEYRRELEATLGIVFNRLFTLTNMPIRRFRRTLMRAGQLDAYQQLLRDAFNPQAALGVMCRNLVSVSWDGQLYDCDFNQALDLPLAGARRTLWDIERLAELEHAPIAFADHCHGCTAGAGSSYSGALA